MQAPKPTDSEVAVTITPDPSSYMEPEVVWGLQTSRDPAVIMDTVLGLVDKYFPSFPEAVKQIEPLYFGIGWDLIEELKKFQQDLGQSVSSSIWQANRKVIDISAGHLSTLYWLIMAGSSHDEFLLLLEDQQEHTNLFTPLDDESTYFPLFTAWSAMFVTLYLSLLRDKTWFNKFTAGSSRRLRRHTKRS
eukprot:Gregarina_sp_Pseudo_9__1378@NODE_1922_length_1249_cov_148_430579_g1782_i0_p1_GENE_NODE_1922_length_1249_cov_148_430579_g1782_i0NODE_1922_length_1249_cov_148_430579_g1782_i0_p1_ORF_typecomplete_len190_score11_77_NODE_1922_length_1249_cov_148_430579_g1782_i0304873